MQIGSSLELYKPFPTSVAPSGSAVSPRYATAFDRDTAPDRSDPASRKASAPPREEPAMSVKEPTGQGPIESRLAEEQVALLRQLKARDREVRQHEAAHQAVGGSLAGAVSYTFQRGPDGVAYAVGGEVPIDLSSAESPEATIDKMEIVKAAAMAPSQPSPQDLQVAAAATQLQLQAQVQLAAEQKDSRGQSRPGEPELAEGQSGMRTKEEETVQEVGQAKNAASVYQRIGNFMTNGRPEGSMFEARA